MKEKKDALRTIIDKQLKSLSDEKIKEKSAGIVERVLSLPQFEAAETILGYMSMPKEADVSEILRYAFSRGKEVAVPRMKGGREMDFHLLESIDGPWDNHIYGIREPHIHLPVLQPAACPSESILILVPGLAFDRDGNRLGRGKGFYDTYLSLHCENIFAVGIGFSFQIVENVPVSDHDQCLQGIITEKEIILS